MHMQSIAIADGLNLASLTVGSDAPAGIPPSVSRIFVCDVSGSMWNDLPQVGRHLKNNISLTVADGDTLTLMWFSGRGQFGTIVEGYRVDDVADLSALHGAIDRYLSPVGLTGFTEPLQAVKRSIGRLRAADPSAAISLVFMSDGYDNVGTRAGVLAAAADLSEDIAAGAVVEYGWHANRSLLTAMAEAMGVPYVFAEDFERFAPMLDAEFRRTVDGVRKRDLALGEAPLHDVCFAVRGGTVACYGVLDGRARVPEDIGMVYFLSARPQGGRTGLGAAEFAGSLDARSEDPAGLYAALAILSQRMASGDVLRVLKALGDVRLIRMFANCFGKQQYSAFQAAAVSAAVDARLRWTDGYDPALVPPDDAYTVLDLLSDLMEDEGNLLHLSHPAFAYQRIGRRTETAASRLTADEQAEIAALAAAARSAADLDRVQVRMAEIAAAKPRAVTFKADAEDAGVPLSSLTLNETRPNVSILVRREGTVDASGNGVGLPDRVPTFTYRNYAVIRDGIVNVKTLPVSLTRASHTSLLAKGAVGEPWVDGAVYELSLERLPIVNRRMVGKVSARECFGVQYELAKARAAQKVFKGFEDSYFPKERAAGLKDKFGEAAAEWLKAAGVTDGGFSPKTVQAAATDVYIGRELKISLEGMDSLPKVSDVVKKLADRKKLTPREALMAPAILECQDFVDSPIYGNAADPKALLKTWLTDKSKAWVKRSRELTRTLAETKFAVVVGQVWFPEFSSLDEGTLTFVADDGAEITGKATLEDIEVAV